MKASTRFTAAIPVLSVAIAGAASAQSPIAPPPLVQGPLAIHVAYPGAGSAVDAADSTFLFGTVGDGRASLTIAGQPARVSPNGAWIAWIALPHDSSFVLPMVARVGADSATATLSLSHAGWVRETGAWIDRNSMYPIGDVWMPADEPLALTVRAAPGATVRLLLPDGTVVPFAADSLPAPPPEGIRNFDRDDRNLSRSISGNTYVGVLRRGLNATGSSLDSVVKPSPLRRAAILEVTIGRRTSRVPWALDVTRTSAAPVGVVLDDDPARLGGTDRITIGRAYPGGTYAWFLPQGTRTRADMRVGDQVRLRLAHDAIAWVPLTDVHRAGAADDPRDAIMGSPVLTPAVDRIRLRIPLTRPVPISVDEESGALHISLFGVVANANWTRYGADDGFVSTLTWEQVEQDRLTLQVSFTRSLWGWRVRVDGTDLVLDFRMPPNIDAARPMAGRRIVVDPGHPPGGACGPTGLCEPEANLAVARLVRDQLVAAGATVWLTRDGAADLGLWPRVALADSVDADLLVSIHNNALPDGVNPFTNSGTSTFFNHPQSLPLAAAVQARLVASLGLRNLGVARGDLALVRPTWYPAILAEGLFMMFPEQEAALRTAEGRHRYADAVVAGMTDFLHAFARR